MKQKPTHSTKLGITILSAVLLAVPAWAESREIITVGTAIIQGASMEKAEQEAVQNALWKAEEELWGVDSPRFAMGASISPERLRQDLGRLLRPPEVLEKQNLGGIFWVKARFEVDDETVADPNYQQVRAEIRVAPGSGESADQALNDTVFNTLLTNGFRLVPSSGIGDVDAPPASDVDLLVKASISDVGISSEDLKPLVSYRATVVLEAVRPSDGEFLARKSASSVSGFHENKESGIEEAVRTAGETAALDLMDQIASRYKRLASRLVRFEGLSDAYMFDVICKNLQEKEGIFDVRKGDFAGGTGVVRVELRPDAIRRLTDYLTHVKPDTKVEVDVAHDWILFCTIGSPQKAEFEK